MIDPLDVSNPDSFQDGFPHEFFKQLRREAPVYCEVALTAPKQGG